MRTFSIYTRATGEFIGRRIECADAGMLEQFTPEGCAAIEGAHDPLTQRFNVETGSVEPWLSPFALSLTAERVTTAARRAIELLEGRQARAVREMMLADVARRVDITTDPAALESAYAAAADRLADLDRQIAEQRGIINGAATPA